MLLDGYKRSCSGSAAIRCWWSTRWATSPSRRRPPTLFFQLVSGRYERASLIVTSNKPFSAWGEIFGDDATAAAMIDRLVHHAEILALKGDSYRLKDHDLGARPTPQAAETA